MSLHTVYRMLCPEAGHWVWISRSIVHVPLQQKHGVVLGALRRRKLILRAGHERLDSVERGPLVLITANTVVLTVFSVG